MRDRALLAARAGRLDEAERLFQEAAARYPRNATLLNSIGNFHAGHGSDMVALGWFDRALAVDPAHVEAALNRAVILNRTGRSAAAAAWLRQREGALRSHPRYWTGRGAAELASGDPASAQSSYDAALRIDPRNARALQGRAQAALERGSEDAVEWHERALSIARGDRFVVRGLARALQASARISDALALTSALTTQVPDWIEGLEAHAAMRWAAGEREFFCDHFATAAARSPSPGIYASWAATLAGVDRHVEAVHVAAEGVRRWPDDHHLAAMELMAAGSCGDLDRADAILATRDYDDPNWAIHRARHSLRRGDPAATEAILAPVLEKRPGDVSGWSLRDVAWRMLDDPRHDWLSGQPGLIRELPLAIEPDDLTRITLLLQRLHVRAAMPIGQSVKQGSQTFGALLAREERELTLLSHAITEALATYRAGLPAHDPDHPLLRHRAEPWKITGSWSIRLHGEGRHAAHIHPRGILSSASYFLVPPTVEDPDRPGWLELGRPPADLGTDLPALVMVKPRAGHAVLFPSTLFHGTRPIIGGTRMTVAFDVGAA